MVPRTAVTRQVKATRSAAAAITRVRSDAPRTVFRHRAAVTASPSRGRNSQDIADTADGVNQAWLTLVDLTPQVTDARLDHVAVAGRVVLPDLIEYLLLAQDAAGVGHQEPQQPELGGRQRYGDAIPPDFMAVFVELDRKSVV